MGMIDQELDPIMATTTGFAEMVLGLSLYPWQAKALLPLEKATGVGGKRQNIAVVAPNGSGKDDRIIPAATFWWLAIHPRGQVVITSKSDTQLSRQTLPSLNKHYRKFGWAPPVNSPRYTLVTPTGGSLIAFVTNEGARSEGFHSRPGEPLLMIVNEAKSVAATNYEGIDRCSPDALILISSPGGMTGRFFECFTKLAALYTTIRAGLADCPHITKEQIESVIAVHGENSPVTRSTLHGEFMPEEEGVFLCCTDTEFESCLSFPPEWKPGFKFGFFDFADGRAENVFFLRDGNQYTKADAWRDANEDAVVGRALRLIAQHNLKPSQVKGDAAAKSIIDKMASAGVAIGRQNFGAIDKTGTYKSWSAMAWLEGCQKIKNREVIIPDDAVLRAQVTTRRQVFELNGKLGVEPKHKMLDERGLESPDRADALFGAMAEFDTSLSVGRSIIDMSDWHWGGKQGAERDLVAAIGF